MALSFPYPKMGTVSRPLGQGCLSCVKNGSCLALYWFRRNGEGVVDDHVGVRCLSWSNNPADVIAGGKPDDLAENEYLSVQEVLFDSDDDQRPGDPS